MIVPLVATYTIALAIYLVAFAWWVPEGRLSRREAVILLSVSVLHGIAAVLLGLYIGILSSVVLAVVFGHMLIADGANR